MSGPPLGAIIAGGASSRFGEPKALALLDGDRIVDRVAAALGSAVPDIVVIANDPAIRGALPFDSRPDAMTGIGALAGVYTALLWARERSTEWIIAIACDMPFVEPALFELLARSCASNAADVVVPASGGPRGIEPLCAAYSTTCIDSIRASIEQNDPRMIGFHRDVRVHTIPLERVSAIGDPGVLFMNVNTPADLERAADIIERKRADA